MNRFLFFALMFSASVINAQTVENVSVGAAYANQTFYKISDGSTQSSPHSDWHIAFSVSGAQGAGIFINEGAALSSTAVKLYASGQTDFNASIDTNNLTELANSKLNWQYGAFNENRNLSDPFDYGWGQYSMITHKVEAAEVFVLRLPNLTLKKIIIDSLSGGAYYFRYSDIDGNNVQSRSVRKSDYSGNNLAYFSLIFGNFLNNVEPSTGWDLLFTRYSEMIPNGQGGMTPYIVTGVLSAPGVEIAQADGVNPSAVNSQDYTDSLSSENLYIIGSDWKNFDFTNGWSVVSDRAYFVKTAYSHLWKIVIIDFQGSGTGITTLQKTDLGAITSSDNLTPLNEFVKVVPNPVNGSFQIVLEREEGDAQVEIYNIQGQLIYQQNIYSNGSLQVINVSDLQLNPAQYVLRISNRKKVETALFQSR